MDKLGLIGAKLGYSFSKVIHTMSFDFNKIKAEYDLIEVQTDEIKDVIDKLKNKDLLGINVTIPHKMSVMQYLDVLSPEAQKIGAVNTICYKEGKLTGFNTDYFGFLMTLENFSIDVRNKKVFVLGSGGAAKAVVACIQDLEGEVTIVSRPEDNAEENFSDENITFMSYDELEAVTEKDVLINCTPCGTYPNTEIMALSEMALKGFTAVVDVVYNPEKTLLLRKAEENGAKAVNGLFMLVAQAIKADEFYYDIEISKEITNRIYRKISRDLYKKNIALIGMPGCGKTTIGEMLSKELNKDFYDVDHEIEKKSDRLISDIFAEDGEAEFRRLETEMTKELANKSEVIISTGGGVVKNFENIKALNENSIIVFIDRTLEDIFGDIETSHRPLLAEGKERLTKLYGERYNLYKKYSDIIISNNVELEKLVSRILIEI